MSGKKGPHLWGRRELAIAIGWWSVIGALVIGTLAFVRMLFRRAPIRAPTTFSAGRPTDYRPDSVSEAFLNKWGVFLVRSDDALFALHARCTHLGCAPRWRAKQRKFKCPCHGSGFHPSGVNFEGPAPTPLYRAKIWLEPDGTVRVDVGQRIAVEQWHTPGAKLSASQIEGA